MSDSTVANEHTRRSFLDVLLSLGVVGSLGSVFYPVLRYLTPLPAAGPTGPAMLTQDELATLEQKHFVGAVAVPPSPPCPILNSPP